MVTRLVIFGGSDTNENFLNDVFVLSLSQLTWEKLVCSGDIPTGRTKHSAVIHENKLIISGKLFHCRVNAIGFSPSVVLSITLFYRWMPAKR